MALKQIPRIVCVAFKTKDTVDRLSTEYCQRISKNCRDKMNVIQSVCVYIYLDIYMADDFPLQSLVLANVS